MNKAFTLNTLLDTWYTLKTNEKIGISVTVYYNMDNWIKYGIEQETYYFENLDDLICSDLFKYLRNLTVTGFYDTMEFYHNEHIRERYSFKISLYD